MREVDTRIEQRNRHASTVVARQVDLGPMSARGTELLGREQRLRYRGGKRGPHRVDAGDLRKVLQDRHGSRVERCGKAVENSRVAEVGVDCYAKRRKGRQHLL